jgi:hypothetical protein
MKVFNTAHDCLHHLNCVEWQETKKSCRGPSQASRVVGDNSFVVFVKSSLVKKDMWDSALSDATASSSVTKLWGKVFANFHAVTVQCHSSMWNWLFGLQGQILCKQSPWCQRKWWACPSLCSSSVLHFYVSVSPDFSTGRIVALSKGHIRTPSSHHHW